MRGSLALAGMTALGSFGADGGKANGIHLIYQQEGATEAEQFAAKELAANLQLITGDSFRIQSVAGKDFPESGIIVGSGTMAQALFPDAGLDKLGPEEFVIRSKDRRLLLAGGRPRGTLYAVYHFLQSHYGARWWTPWATTLPHCDSFHVPKLNERIKPAFGYRYPYWFDGENVNWKVRNGVNGGNIPDKLGGSITYAGFVHTFYALVPPAKYFTTHPEWYSLINGKRTHHNAQLCLSNPQLRDFVVQQVKERLRESPDASIISVSQNDCGGACECPNCRAIDKAKGSPSGSIIAFVNYIAKKIEPDFPNVAVDTLAYQYSRKPPKSLRPRANVIVRLCSIECNFRDPLDAPSNALFLADLEAWSKICHRLYIWNYTTDFSNYVLPFPNWFTLGPNVRTFKKYGVEGVFEEGAYQGYGAEMGELRVWLLSQLLWNPEQDDRALIKEFLEGYYGKTAAKPIHRYLKLMFEASKGFYLRCNTSSSAPYLKFKVLAQAERLWQEAETATASCAEKLARVQVGHLPVRLAFLRNWTKLRQECQDQKATWPLPESRKAVVKQFGEVCQGVPGEKWSRVQILNEGGLTVDKFLQK